MPTLNQGQYLDATLRSLLAQREIAPQELEVIVIDGGSTDGTIEILKNYESDLIQWTSGPDKGQTDALRIGFSQATGEIFGWLCSDDLLEPWAVREVLDFFRGRPQTDFVYGDAWWISQDGSPLRPKREIPFSRFIWLHDHNYIPQPAAFWRRRLYEQVGGLDPSFHLAMDGDLFARFAERTEPIHVMRQWARLRSHPGQRSRLFRERSRQEDRIIRQRLGVSYRNRLSGAAHYCVAKSWRVAWKLVTRAYSPRRMPAPPPKGGCIEGSDSR